MQHSSDIDFFLRDKNKKEVILLCDEWIYNAYKPQQIHTLNYVLIFCITHMLWLVNKLWIFCTSGKMKITTRPKENRYRVLNINQTNRRLTNHRSIKRRTSADIRDIARVYELSQINPYVHYYDVEYVHVPRQQSMHTKSRVSSRPRFKEESKKKKKINETQRNNKTNLWKYFGIVRRKWSRIETHCTEWSVIPLSNVTWLKLCLMHCEWPK